MATTFRKVAVVGAGAVGSFYGAMLARAGHPVVLIGRPAHVEAIRRDGLKLEMGGRTETVALDARSEIVAARDADLVLVSVKSSDTEAVARELAPLLAGNAVVVSLQNGVENADVIAHHVDATVVPAVVYVATAMPAPGVVRHHGRGDLVVGPRTRAAADDAALGRRLDALVAFFATAGVAVKVSVDVVAELWSKLMVNCAYNAISALAQSSYGEMVALAPIRELQRTVVGEVVAVAAASGVELPLAAAIDAMERIAPAMPAQLS
ncbi:MAG TPA: 2-dehydropantoate 2-reductase, partial [Caldimonas sp.]|nr:2-dehydropantoate 2-reductase [Caldimonas sp.]